MPTFVEAGFAELVVTSWAGLDAPKGTPSAIVERLHDAAIKAVQSKEVQDRLSAEGWIPFATTSQADFDKFVRAETTRWLRTIKDAGIQIE